MAISIINGTTALGSVLSSKFVPSNINNTIQSLSSGSHITIDNKDISKVSAYENFKRQIQGLSKAATNAQDGISMLQQAETSLSSISDLVMRIKELSIQAGSSSYTNNDRDVFQQEIDTIKTEIDRLAKATEFNTKKTY